MKKQWMIEWGNLLIQTIISLMIAFCYIYLYKHISVYIFTMREGILKMLVDGYMNVLFFGSSPIIIYLIFHKFYPLQNKK